MSRVTVHTDGAARGNPGPASIAFVIQDGEERREFSEKIGQTTNNQAEYRAMLAACRSLIEHLPTNAVIAFHSDSELMIKQLRGEYRVKDVNLQPLFGEIANILRQLERNGNTIELLAIRREFNKRADELANIALDS